MHATGLTLAVVVDDLEGELAGPQNESVTITKSLTAQEWGECAFQVRDHRAPNSERTGSPHAGTETSASPLGASSEKVATWMHSPPRPPVPPAARLPGPVRLAAAG